MKHILTVKNLGVTLGEKKILSHVNLILKSGEIQALMGPNGSGKSTLSLALAGHPSYTINNKSSAMLDRKDLLPLKPEERARLGLFVGFQQPVAIPGVRVLNFLRLARNNINKGNNKKNIESILEFKNQLTREAQRLALEPEFLKRSLNDGFSGG
ncbi:ATP-binding cassette domain-containing protein, partial [Candidatus Microgenomates bacterium]|nr:ATP-binding cassette domain-containing protein [Candidatus Microgenomates bacterium]